MQGQGGGVKKSGHDAFEDRIKHGHKGGAVDHASSAQARLQRAWHDVHDASDKIEGMHGTLEKVEGRLEKLDASVAGLAPLAEKLASIERAMRGQELPALPERAPEEAAAGTAQVGRQETAERDGSPTRASFSWTRKRNSCT